MTNSKPERDYRLPVSEIYGPVAQGEGAQIGTPTIFVRLGGCDYRCSWCDSLYAVLPEYRNTWAKLTPDEVVEKLLTLNTWVSHITLSGGNPAIHPAGRLVDTLHHNGFTVHVETQGTLAPDWLKRVDSMAVSPKPPSSGNVTSKEVLNNFLTKYEDHFRRHQQSLKIVVFNDADFAYAQDIHAFFPYIPLFLQVGTDQATETFSREKLLEAFQELQEKALHTKGMQNVRVLPQLHAVLHGLKRGI